MGSHSPGLPISLGVIRVFSPALSGGTAAPRSDQLFQHLLHALQLFPEPLMERPDKVRLTFFMCLIEAHCPHRLSPFLLPLSELCPVLFLDL